MAGATLLVESGPITVENVEQIVSTAAVEGYFKGLVCDTCFDSDTATVNVVSGCTDQVTQDSANLSGTLVETINAGGQSLCAPELNNPDGDVESVKLLCNANCKLRTGCEDNPNSPSCLFPCKPSGNWSQVDTNGQCHSGTPSRNNLPLCNEVMNNITNSTDCADVQRPRYLRTTGNKNTFSVNPTIICVGCDQGGGGDSTGTIYCLLGPNDTAEDCPQGAFVF